MKRLFSALLAPVLALTDPAACLTVGGSPLYALRMSEAELIAAAGEPDDKLVIFSGPVWYVYGTDTYEDFFMAGVCDATVAALCSAGVSFYTAAENICGGYANGLLAYNA